MKISDIFKQRAAVDQSKLDAQSKNQNAIDAAKGANGDVGGADKISISPLAKQFSQIARILNEDEEDRRARVAELKAKVESGEYEVSSHAVAEAIIQFANSDENRLA